MSFLSSLVVFLGFHPYLRLFHSENFKFVTLYTRTTTQSPPFVQEAYHVIRMHGDCVKRRPPVFTFTEAGLSARKFAPSENDPLYGILAIKKAYDY